MHLLIVEDEERLAKALKKGLELKGYAVDWLPDPEKARSRILLYRNEYDLIILDLMLPGLDGAAITESVRQEGVTTPIVILTARNETEHKVDLLNKGADDYIVKPFSVRELLARIRVQLRRDPEVAETPRYERFRFGDVLVDFKRRQVFRHGILQPVTPREFRVLEYLLQHPGEVLGRDRLLGEVWGDDARFTTRTVDNHIMRIRKHVEPDPENPRYIKTVRGSGYLLDVAVPAAR